MIRSFNQDIFMAAWPRPKQGALKIRGLPRSGKGPGDFCLAFGRAGHNIDAYPTRQDVVNYLGECEMRKLCGSWILPIQCVCVSPYCGKSQRVTGSQHGLRDFGAWVIPAFPPDPLGLLLNPFRLFLPNCFSPMYLATYEQSTRCFSKTNAASI